MRFIELHRLAVKNEGGEYVIGTCNGEPAVWAPELGPEESVVLASDLGSNWGGDDDDLQQLYEACMKIHEENS